MPALAWWGVWDASRVSPSGEWQNIPTQHYRSTHTGGQCAGRLLCSWGCATTPQLCLQIHHCRLLGFSAAPREYAFGWTCVFWAECHFGYIFLFILFFFLKRDLKRGSCISALLSYHDNLWLYFFMCCSLPTAASLFELTGLKPSVVCLHLKSVQNHQRWIWTMYLFVMLQLVALVMIIVCHKENILSSYTEQTAGTF